MRGAGKTGLGRAMWGDAPLRPCFLAALLAAALMLSDGPRWSDMALALLAILTSAVACCYVLRHLLTHFAQRAIADAGGAHVRSFALAHLAATDRFIIDGLACLRRAPRTVAAHQPNLDPRLKALLCALAEQSHHILSEDVASALHAEQVKPDSLVDVYCCASGGVTGEWRSHRVSLVVPSATYGARRLCLGLTIDGETAASFYFDENLRTDAMPLIASLNSMGIESMLYDPDRAEMLGCAARQLGVMVQAQMSNVDRAAAMGRQQATGRKLIMLRQNEDGRGFFLIAPDRAQPLMEAEALSAIPGFIAIARRTMVALRHGAAGIGSFALVATVLALAGVHPIALAAGVCLSSLMLIGPLRYWMLAETRTTVAQTDAVITAPVSL